MLSRRSVRVKVMQLLYSMDRDSAITDKVLINAYDDSITRSYELFLFNLYLLEKVVTNAQEDLKKRSSKHLPSEYDKAFSAKIYTNDLIQDIVNNKTLKKKFETLNFDSKLNDEYAQKIYDSFSKKDEYRNYVKAGNSKAETIEILLELYRFCRQNEYFNDTLEDAYFNWLDDKSLVVGAVKKYLKALPNDNPKLYADFLPEDETVKEFGLNLLKSCLTKKEDLMKIIIPVLENWDHERLAIVDTILLQMAVCELLEFPTIPCKVTLNEYVELAKQYSTAKSKEFINGILDKLMKDLEADGRLKKEGRGLVS